MRKRKHTPEFREEAVKKVLTGHESVKEIAERFGISHHTLQQWKREYMAAQKNDSPEIKTRSGLEEEIKRLKKELSDAKMDNLILKKYAAMLSRED